MKESGNDVPLRHLERRLWVARVRWFLARFTEGTLWSAALAAVVAFMVRLAFPVGEVSYEFEVAAGAALLGLLASAVAAWLATPNMDVAAVRAEHAYGLKSQLSTAREAFDVRGSTAAQRALRSALLADARRLSTRIQPERVAPFGFGIPHGIAVVITVAALVGVAFVDEFVTRDGSIPPNPSSAAVLSGGEREALGEELSRLADSVAAEADRQEDAYLGALAEATRHVARDVRAGSQGVAVTRKQLGRLMSHLGEALGPRHSLEEVSEAEAPVEMLAADLSGPGREAVRDDKNSAKDGELDEIVGRLGALRASLDEAQAQRTDGFYDAAIDSGVRSEPEGFGDERAGNVAEGDAAGAPAGGARESTYAPGDAAGEGSQALDAGARQGEIAFDALEEMTLPEAAIPGVGARVFAAGEPEADADIGLAARDIAGRPSESEGVGNVDLGPAVEGGKRDEDGGWRRSTLPPGARVLASRLLEPEKSPEKSDVFP